MLNQVQSLLSSSLGPASKSRERWIVQDLFLFLFRYKKHLASEGFKGRVDISTDDER